MLQIAFSLPITLVIYKLIFGIGYFDSVHLLSVFIVLGISADNFFVIKDAWEQAAIHHDLIFDDQKRMAYTLRRGFKAILATSLTTTIAFLASGLSPVRPISGFGLFAAVMVFVNFIFSCTWVPAVIMLHHKYVRYRFCVCITKDKKYKKSREEYLRKKNEKLVTLD